MVNNKKIITFFLFSIFYLLNSNSVLAADLFFLPQSQTIYKGDTFIVEIRLNTGGEEVNALEANLKFPPELLEVLDISKGGSVLNLWPTEPFFSNSDGRISLMGGMPGGFKGQGMAAQITFRGKELGKAILNFKETSQALLNDGEGTQADLDFLEGTYEIIQMPEGLPKISSASHPDQNKWFNNNTLYLHWDLAEGAEYSYILSRDAQSLVDDAPDRPEGELEWMGDIKYKNLEDGIYYFFLKQKLPGENWSPKISFRAMVDATPPEKFTIEIGQDPSVFEGKYFLGFSTTDKISGIDYYEVKEGKEDFKKAEIPYLLKDQSLKSRILVRAVDKAGNEQISEIIPPKEVPSYFSLFSSLVSILFGLIIIILVIRKIRNSKLKNK
ncbi:MAG: hypothetical protein A2Z78_02020 [Candidatus Nealsonbacteria bacterium RBG_13_36_15]|uniref:Cohesin domain-containing protein n=1 Tax=Candidatus Nealsonbacteria bacterium RBG_13_36_15 TaxID=1801660 RepID=A0A1G2DV38_9BACT|nr:MAG: hypothetical protein A2Z78_02020 [Candidatus Nealsonbacteria bacterium RBG_13_36_15]